MATSNLDRRATPQVLIVVAVVAGLLMAGGLLLRWVPAQLVGEPTPIPHEFSWAEGATRSHRLRLDSDVRLDLPEFGIAQRFEQRVAGTLHMRVYGLEGERIAVGFQLQPARYLISDRSEETIEQGLSVPFRAYFEPNGRPLSFEFAGSPPREAQIILEEVVRTFQVVLNDEPGDTWRTVEDHATGRYVAEYRIDRTGLLNKRKLAYETVRSAIPSNDVDDAPRVEFARSETEVELATGSGWLESARIEERLAVVQGEHRVSEMSMEGSLESVPTPSSSDFALLRYDTWDATRQGYTRTQELAASTMPRSASTPDGLPADPKERWSALVDRLNRQEAGRIGSLRGLVDLLKAHPALAAEVLASVEKPGMHGNTAAMLVQALELAGTPAAQKALVDLMNDASRYGINRSRAIVALGGIETPTPETLTALLAASSERGDADRNFLANASILSYGAIGGTLRASDPQRATAISRELVQRLGTARDAAEIEVTLKAMGNTGDRELSGDVAAYLDDRSPHVRAAAAQTLGRVRAEDTGALLTDHLGVEPKAEVRSAIVQSLNEFDAPRADTLVLVNELVLDEPAAEARYHMADYLGDEAHDYAEADRTLAQLVLSDSSDRVRRLAAARLKARRQRER